MLLLPFRGKRYFLPWIFVGTTLLLLAVFYRQEPPTRRIFDHLRPHSWYPGALRNPHFPPLRDGCPESEQIPKHSCADFPSHLLKDVQIVFKTGVGERERARIALETYASCISNLLIVSDAPDYLAGHDIVDVLADLPKSYAEDPDWGAYAAQREAFKPGNSVSKSYGGWRLDRFKFLPMVDKAFEVNPYAKWYVFIETDIYMFWDILFRSLDRLDPDEKHYLGSPSAGSYDRWFAYGGAGIVMSRGLLRPLLRDGSQKLGSKYEQMVRDDCCGDAVLAYAILEELPGTRMAGLYPTFSGEVPEEVTVTKEKWCKPLASLHRVSAETMEKLWRWERCRPYTDTPITYSTFLDFGLTPLLDNTGWIDGWDNGADDSTGAVTVTSVASCSKACDLAPDCMQFSYRKGVCFLSDFVRIGRATEDTTGTTSGWQLRVLEQLGYRHRPDLPTTCKSVHWLRPKIIGPE